MKKRDIAPIMHSNKTMETTTIMTNMTLIIVALAEKKGMATPKTINASEIQQHQLDFASRRK
jgi:hypothetical protein